MSTTSTEQRGGLGKRVPPNVAGTSLPTAAFALWSPFAATFSAWATALSAWAAYETTSIIAL